MANSAFRVPDLIMKKRDGKEFTQEEINFLVESVSDSNNNNSIQQSQIGALLMAIFFRGMNFNESFYLTKAMMNSGAKLDFSQYRGCVVDKHSTGGVGDKISLPLAPALVACGLKVPMISGRGLGWTGGTLDKLESIPGYNASFSKIGLEKIVDEVGCCIVGQTQELNPADRILYATRDITSTVDCIPLIAGSIVSKKAIEDLDALVLDVKIGRAAFIKELDQAENLASYMVQIAKMLGIKAAVFITNHDNPLGRTIGNQIEIEETVECLHGNVPSDLHELITKFGGYLLYRTSKCASIDEGAKMIAEKLNNGEALEHFKKMIIAQGVDESLAIDLCEKRNYEKVFGRKAKYTSHIKGKETGYIESIDALELGMTACKLGAGRSKAGDIISYEVGMRLIKTIGDKIEAGETWLEVYHNEENFDALYEQNIKSSISISQYKVESAKSLVEKIIDFM